MTTNGGQSRAVLGAVLVLFFMPANAALEMFAEDEPDKPHSLSIERKTDEDTFSGSQQSYDIEPHSWRLHYGYQVNEIWGLGVSVWTGEDEAQFSERLFFDKDLSGLSASLGHQVTEWWWRVGFYISRDEAQLQLTQQGQSSEFFQEETDTQEVFFSLNYDLDWQLFTLSPSLGLAYQRSEYKSRQDFVFRDTLTLRETRLEKSDGGYLSGSLTASYLWDISESMLWVPSLTFGWGEPVWGDVVNTTNREAMTDRGSRNQSSQDFSEDSTGSGYSDISLMVLVGDYFSSVSYTRSIGNDNDGSSLAVQLGLDF